jgi:hypothetical protein
MIPEKMIEYEDGCKTFRQSGENAVGGRRRAHVEQKRGRNSDCYGDILYGSDANISTIIQGSMSNHHNYPSGHANRREQ